MKFSAATVLAAVAGAQAYAYSNVTYTTEVVTAVTTYCPGPTQITYGGETYTISEATTLTITKCPGGCTVTYPVHTVSSAPSYTNATGPATVYPTGTGSISTAAPAVPTYPADKPPVTAGASKAVALSGAALAGVLGFAALL